MASISAYSFCSLKESFFTGSVLVVVFLDVFSVSEMAFFVSVFFPFSNVANSFSSMPL